VNLGRLANISRRTLYAILFVACALPFLVTVRLPLYVWQETRYIYDRIEACPPDRVVAISSEWIAGSQGENWPQYEAIVSHCMMKGVKLVVFSHEADPLAPQFAETINQRQAELYGRKYGEDWVNLGLSRGGALVMGQIGRNLKGVYPQDFYGNSTTDYEALPILQDVHAARDFHLFMSITYQPSTDWLIWLDPTGRTPIAFGSAGIVTTGYYPYIASGQLRGMLAGVRGAAEYEELARLQYGDRYHMEMLRGQKLLVPLAFGHLVIIGFVVLGNIGMFALRRRRAESG
jgi:hypothetical protein